jgi:hypothetical protein
MKELKMININNKESMINEIMDTACIAYRIYLKTCHKSNELIGDIEIEYPKYSMAISDENQYKTRVIKKFYNENELLKVLFSIKEELTKMENQYTEVLKKIFAERKNLYVLDTKMTKKAFMQLAHKKTKNLVKNTDCDYRTTLSLVIKRLYEVIKMDIKVKKEMAEREKTLKTRISNIFSVDTNENTEVTITNWKNQRVYVTLKSKNHNHQLFINLINNNVICNSKCHAMYDVARYVDKYKHIVIDCAK